MKINKIEIGNFGKFQNYNISFDDGINIIYGNNEDGKSTIMAFIKMMFYGSTGKSVDLSKNIRKKYMPWNGAKMSGAVEFEDKGVIYRLEKTFGASNATDKVSLWNKTTGEKEKIASATDVGQRFFGIGAAAFEKSVFISQIGSTISNDGDKEDEITQKLLNLVSTGDESVSQKKVTERLRLAKEALKSKSGRIGTLDKLNKSLESLYSERIASLEDEKTKKLLEEQYLSLAQAEEKLKNDYELNKSQYSIQEKMAELEKLQNLISKKQDIDKLLADYNSKRELLNKGDIIFDNEFIKKCGEQISQVQTCKRLCDEKTESLKLLESENTKLAADKVCEISKEYMETVKSKQKDEDKLLRSIDTLKNSIKEINEFAIKKGKVKKNLEDSKSKLDTLITEKQEKVKDLKEIEIKVSEEEKAASKARENYDHQNAMLDDIKRQKDNANTAYQLTVNNTNYVKKLSDQKVQSAEEKLKEASTPRQVVTNEKERKSINKQLLIASIAVLVISIALGAVINPICYAGAVIGVILGILSFSKNKNKSTTTTTTTIVDEAEVNKAKQNLSDVKSDKDREVNAALEEEQKAEKKLKELEAKEGILKSEVSRLEQVYIDSSSAFANDNEKFKDIKAKLGFIDEKLSVAEAEAASDNSEFQEIISGNSNINETDLQKLQLELEEKSAAEAALKDSIDKLLMDKDCKTIDELQNKYAEWQSYEAKMNAKAEQLQRAICDGKDAKFNFELSMKEIIQTVSQYTDVDSLDTAVNAIDQLKNDIDKLSEMKIKINSQAEFLDNEIQGKTIQEIEQNVVKIREEILRLNNGTMSEKCDESQLDQLKQLDEELQEKIRETKEEMIKLELTTKNKFIGKKNVSEVDEEIRQLNQEMQEKEDYYQCLDIAESSINEAFNEISQSFGPLLNTKTTEIFNSLTDGKYQNVIISRNFDINVQNAGSVTSHEWKYLSNGTIDQAYFALRLSISDLFSKSEVRLPLMLDDVFLQYDEERAEQGLKFLVDYAKKDGISTQVIMFTCQKSIVELSKKNNEINNSSIN